MAWVKLDDQFADHPKVLAAGPLAAWLYVAGLCYSARQLTDGFIPSGMARRLADVPDVEAAIAALVDAELWDEAEGGYRIHDYLEYQPSKDRVLATRDARADAGSRGGKQRASNLVERGYEPRASKTVPRTHPVPVPVLDHTPTEAESEVGRGGSVSRGKRATALPRDFPLTAGMKTWAGQHAPGVDLALHHERFCNYWWGEGKTKPDWSATWRNWMLREQDTANRAPPGRSHNGKRETLSERNDRVLREVFGDGPPDVPEALEATFRRDE